MKQENGKVQYSNGNVVIDDGGEVEKFDERCLPQLKRMPTHTWAVLMTELCERFSYYGIKAVLVIYLTKALQMSKSDGKAYYHAFSMVSYFTGVIGAVFADTFFGKYMTIFWSLVLYSVAEVVLTLTTIPSIGNNNSAGPLIGLFVMATACGNIKPILAAFGGEQFNQKDTGLIQTFFSMFYMSVNVGAMLTMIFAPMMRTDIKCYGTNCYPVVFGVNCIIIILATISFMAGSKWYTKKQPEGSVMIRVVRIIGHAIEQATKSSGQTYQHWLYNAQDKYEKSEIEDVRSLLKVLVLYIPLPVFWALFHQQGSSWTLQAEQMDGDLGSIGTLRADQMQFFNAALVLILIPIFDHVIYPMFERCGFELTPLKRMTGGMILAAIAFAITGFMQIKIQDVNSPPALPPPLKTSIDFINVSPCQKLELEPGTAFQIDVPYGGHSNYLFVLSGQRSLPVKGINCFSNNDTYENDIQMTLIEGVRQSVLIDITDMGVMKARLVSHSFPKVDVTTSDTRVRMIYVPSTNMSDLVHIKYKHEVEEEKSSILKNYTASNTSTEFMNADEYSIEVSTNSGETYPVTYKKDVLKLGTFGAYTITLKRPMHRQYSKQLIMHAYEDVKSTSVHRIWQLPQYVVITAGEVMFSVTGLAFAYSQAPPSMKSVLQACWLVTTAFGDLLVVILSIAKPVNGVEKEMFLYGGIMIVVAMLFAFMSYFYTYSDFSGNTVESPTAMDEKPLDELEMSKSDSTQHF